MAVWPVGAFPIILLCMTFRTTALGRMVPENEFGTDLQDLILKLLFDYRMSPFNSSNAPMPLSSLAGAARVDPKRVEVIAESLRELSPPLVERVEFQGGAYRITGQGVLFVQNASQGLQGFQGPS